MKKKGAKKKVKHTTHSLERLGERARIDPDCVRKRLREGDFIGLPKQTNNKRVAVMPDLDGKPLVVIWLKRSEEIVTVFDLDWYLERHELSPKILAEIERRYPPKGE